MMHRTRHAAVLALALAAIGGAAATAGTGTINICTNISDASNTEIDRTSVTANITGSPGYIVPNTCGHATANFSNTVNSSGSISYQAIYGNDMLHKYGNWTCTIAFQTSITGQSCMVTVTNTLTHDAGVKGTCTPATATFNSCNFVDTSTISGP